MTSFITAAPLVISHPHLFLDRLPVSTATTCKNNPTPSHLNCVWRLNAWHLTDWNSDSVSKWVFFSDTHDDCENLQHVSGPSLLLSLRSPCPWWEISVDVSCPPALATMSSINIPSWSWVPISARLLLHMTRAASSSFNCCSENMFHFLFTQLKCMCYTLNNQVWKRRVLEWTSERKYFHLLICLLLFLKRWNSVMFLDVQVKTNLTGQ